MKILTASVVRSLGLSIHPKIKTRQTAPHTIYKNLRHVNVGVRTDVLLH